MTAGTPILTAQFSDLHLVVEAAFGSAPGDDSGPWTDITGYLQSPAVSTTIGRADQTSQTQPAAFGCVLDNSSRLFSKGPQGTSAGLDRIPIRERIIWNGVSYTRFRGEAIGFTPRWDPIGKTPIVMLSAAGSLRRINGSGRQPPLASTMRHYVPAQPSLVAYWPMEEGADATSFAAATAGTPTMTSSTGNPKPSSYSGFIGSAGAPTLGAEALTAPCPSTGSMNAGQLWLLIHVPAGTLADQTRVATLNVSSAAVSRIDVLYSTASSGSFGFKGYKGNTLVCTGAVADPPGGADSQDVLLGLNWQPWTIATDTAGGPDILFDLEITGLDFFNATLGGNTTSTSDVIATASIATATSVVIAPDAACSGVAVGHLYLQAQALGNAYTVPGAATAFTGEAVTDRIMRLCAEEGESVTVTGASVQTMGPQPIVSFPEALRQCELVDLGVLYDGATAGLSYIARSSRENQTPTLVLDAASGDVVDIPPTDDDLGLLNTFQATRTKGGTSTYSDTDATSVLSVPNVGYQPDSAEINCQADDYLPHYAGFRVNLGEIPGYRYPNVALAVHGAPRILAGWLNTTMSSRIKVLNLDDVRTGDNPRDLDTMVEGWTEAIEKFSWTVGVNATSYDPWHIATFAADTGDIGEFVMRGSPDHSQTVGDAAAGATTLTVSTPSGPTWVTGSGDDFPMDLDVNGLRVTCTSITGAGTTQTFNVAPVALRIPSGSTVDVWVAPRLSL